MLSIHPPVAHPSDSQIHSLPAALPHHTDMALASPTAPDHHTHQGHHAHPSLSSAHQHIQSHHPSSSSSITSVSTPSANQPGAAPASAYYPFYESPHPYAHAHQQHHPHQQQQQQQQHHQQHHQQSHQLPHTGAAHPLSSPLGSPASAADPSFVSMAALSPNDPSRRMSLYDMASPMIGAPPGQQQPTLQANIPGGLGQMASASAANNGPASATTPTSPTRRKGRSNRSVSGMTPDQLERKRANDREAQRRIRQRIKEQIDGNAKEIQELRQEVERLTAQHQTLEAENQQLRTTLEQYRHGAGGGNGDLSLNRLSIVSPTGPSGMISPTHHQQHSDVNSVVAVATAAAVGHHNGHMSMRPPPLTSPSNTVNGSWASGHPETPGPTSAGMGPYLNQGYHPYPFDPAGQMGSPQSEHSQNGHHNPHSHQHSHAHSHSGNLPSMMSPTSPYGQYRSQNATSPQEGRQMDGHDMHPARSSVPQTPVSVSHGLPPPPSSMGHHPYLKSEYVKAE